jgi:hypothetical protein
MVATRAAPSADQMVDWKAGAKEQQRAESTVGNLDCYWAVLMVDLKVVRWAAQKACSTADRLVVSWVARRAGCSVEWTAALRAVQKAARKAAPKDLWKAVKMGDSMAGASVVY